MAHKDTLVLFDVDGTLTVPRQRATEEMFAALDELRKNYTIGIVGGSDLSKQKEQLSDDVLSHFDYVFSENGLHAFHNGQEFHKQSLTKYLGDENMAILARTTLKHLSQCTHPIVRGTFFELRNGMVNISPIGRSCSQSERDAFEKYDHEHQVRDKLIAAIQADLPPNFPKLKYSIGGQISFDVFPLGWDKTYCLQFVRDKFKEIHFFGDKTSPGGNDFEIYTADGVKGHSVKSWQETVSVISEFPK